MNLRRSDRLNRLYFLVLMLSDFLIVALSIVLAVKIRFGSLDTASAPVSAMAGTWVFLVIAQILFMMVENLYVVRTTANKAMNLFRSIRMILIISVVFIVVLFVTHFPTRVLLCSRLSVLITMVFWIMLTVVSRLILIPRLFVRLLKMLRFGKISVKLCGPEAVCRKVMANLRKSPVYSHVLDISIHRGELPQDPEEKASECLKAMKESGCGELMTVFQDESISDIATFCLRVRRTRTPFTVFSERIPELGYFDPWITTGKYGALVFCGREWTASSRVLWRLMDLLISIVGLILLLPLIIVVVPAIALSSPGGVFFRQTRIGRGRKPFTFYKFRSMRVDVKDRHESHKEYFREYVNGKAAAKSENGHVYKTVNSRAVTTVGRIIRKTSIDELPQIINVIKGEMSVVGPRPCIEYELEHYDQEWLNRRFTVKPGLTGIWQVYGRSRLDFRQSQFLDFVYVISRTDGLNIRLILKTFPVVIFGKGGL